MEAVFFPPVSIERYDQQQEAHDCLIKIDLVRINFIKRRIEFLDNEDHLNEECADDRKRAELCVRRNKTAFSSMPVTYPHHKQRDDKRYDSYQNEYKNDHCKNKISPVNVRFSVNIVHDTASRLGILCFVFNGYSVETAGILGSSIFRQHEFHNISGLGVICVLRHLFRRMPACLEISFRNNDSLISF